MKAEITGYITAVINNYTRTIERLKELQVNDLHLLRSESFRKELNDMLDFVTDIQEEKPQTAQIVEDLAKEIKRLENKLADDWKTFDKIAVANGIYRNRIRELEESCENMCQVQRNQLNKIEFLENHIKNLEEIK
jgi:archaellum component FlaC